MEYHDPRAFTGLIDLLARNLQQLAFASKLTNEVLILRKKGLKVQYVLENCVGFLPFGKFIQQTPDATHFWATEILCVFRRRYEFQCEDQPQTDGPRTGGMVRQEIQGWREEFKMSYMVDLVAGRSNGLHTSFHLVQRRTRTHE